MGFASGSLYAQETWDIVRDSIPQKQRAEIARKFYQYWKDLQADDWNPCSNLLQDTELDKFLLSGARLSVYEKFFLVQKLIKEGHLIYWFDNSKGDDEPKGQVRQIQIDGINTPFGYFEVTQVIINEETIDLSNIDKIYWECDYE